MCMPSFVPVLEVWGGLYLWSVALQGLHKTWFWGVLAHASLNLFYSPYVPNAGTLSRLSQLASYIQMMFDSNGLLNNYHSTKCSRRTQCPIKINKKNVPEHMLKESVLRVAPARSVRTPSDHENAVSPTWEHMFRPHGTTREREREREREMFRINALCWIFQDQCHNTNEDHQ